MNKEEESPGQISQSIDAEMNSRLLESLKSTLGKVERYVLVALFSAVVFAVLSLPEAQIGVAPGEGVKWTLFGFSLNFDPRLALIVLYALFFFSYLLADNMLLHIRDLTKRLNKTDVQAVLTHPTILTVSPIGQFVVTLIPSVLICLGLAKSHYSGSFQLHSLVWWFAYGFGGLLGPAVLVRVRQYIAPYLLKDIRTRT
ncbi:MAG: hypothetical protein JSV32_04150 [Dehalococcoidia bacterium]|nr:MAG: hypothetical protein JSV32_04150 [Dehalococcoidia bacterium]